MKIMFAVSVCANDTGHMYIHFANCDGLREVYLSFLDEMCKYFFIHYERKKAYVRHKLVMCFMFCRYQSVIRFSEGLES